MALVPNTLISHYKILSKIGRGGMGEVYLAEDTKLGRQVALKILPAEFAKDTERMNRFVREAKSASALNHPNIITIYEINEFESTNYIATEFIDGKILSEFVRENSLNLGSALDLAIQVASALDEAHQAGIVHRDVKPDTIMVRPNGLVKILDFGIAKLSEAPSATDTVTTDPEAATAIQSGTTPGMIIGTANYMSPEQAKGQEIDARTDIFSFGVVLYEMISGHLPFEGETAMESISSIIKDEPKPLNDSDLPPEIERIISKALRKDRNERYQTIRGLLADLKEVKQELEFQDKLERTVQPNKEEQKTQFLKATTSGQMDQTAASETVNDNITIRKSKLGKAAVGVFLVSLISMIGLGFWYYTSGNPDQIGSIAVLPFENNSENEDSEYLSDGLAESLIYSLSQLPDLKVSPISSVFRYKGKETDPATVARELGVDSVLTGRISERRDNLSISINLVDARNGSSLWGEKYERRMSELLATQKEITVEITNNLKLKLSGESEKKLATNYTADPEAYQLYLKGRHQWNKRALESLRSAADYFNQAIEKDPGFALAYSGLAETYVLFPNYEVMTAADSMPRAKAAALRALELDDTLASPHTALGWYYFTYEYDWAKGEQELRRAIELDPDYATAHQWLAELLAQRKRFDEAAEKSKQAQKNDPLSPIISFNRGWHYYLSRRFDEAISEFNRTLSLHPDFVVAQQGLCWAYERKDDVTAASSWCSKAAELGGSYEQAYLSLALARAGKRDEARKILEELKADSTRKYVPSVAIAICYAGLGDREEALSYLEKEVDERGYWASTFGTDPVFDEFRSEPQFKALLKRMNMPE